ncbi:hypothetical protein LOC68_01930 [Blastopirellula sp. JC732]|uniref:Tyrosine kinase G-rich domain-containing protein n=1 Tax=Blastopirellula sediminis TaxID=2894196 RepID=A0A9X1MJ03_9BACT|nr:hypothetical protein [Blastopirellula sediminis]MCC9608052.1 hypothetical protein [Blastopirellula sediminis]MCC9627155.1 hypothetical protein [Blastopirellula sediminis]
MSKRPETFDVLQALRKHRYSAFAAFVFVLGCVAVILVAYPRKYASTAKVLVRAGRESMTLDPVASSAGETVDLQRTLQSEVFAAIDILQSRQILEDVVENQGPDVILSGHLADESKEDGISLLPLSWLKSFLTLDPISDREKAIRALEDSVEFDTQRESNVVSIHFTSKSPAAAQKILESWVDTFLKKYPELNRTQGSYDFLAEQESVLKEELDAARERLRSSKNEHGLVSLDHQQATQAELLSQVQEKLITVNASLSASTSRLKEIEDGMGKLPEYVLAEEVSGIANEAHDGMRRTLYELELKKMDLQSKMTESHPSYIAISEQVEEARRTIQTQDESRNTVSRQRSETFVSLEKERLLEKANFQSLQAQRETLRKDQAGLLQEMKVMNDGEKEVAESVEKLATLEARYRAFTEKLEQARLDEAIRHHDLTSINVVQRPSLEELPVTPNKKLCILIGLAAACFSAVGIALVRSNRSQPVVHALNGSAEPGDLVFHERMTPQTLEPRKPR